MNRTLAGSCPICANRIVAGDAFCETCGTPIGASGEEQDIALPVARRITNADDVCPGCGAQFRLTGGGYCEECGLREPDLRDHMEVAVAGAAAVSDKGRRRQNQDSFALWAGLDGRVVAVVCDGVSASTRPEEAASQAAQAALGALQSGRAPDEAYLAALEAMAAVAWDPAHDHAGPPSCTMLAATAVRDRAQLVSVGDCRAFWLPDAGEPRALTQDDSWAADQVAAGAMTVEQAYADHRSHVITRWIGADADRAWEPRCVDFVAPGAGRLVLCSDGLWNYAATAPELAAAAGAGPPLSVCHRLVEFAISEGGHDNVTVVVLDLPRAAAPPKGQPSKGSRP